MRRRIGLGQILCYVILSMIAIIMLLPLLHMFAIAVSDTSAVMHGEVYFLPHGFSLEAFRRVLADSHWQASFLFTLFCSVVGMCVSLFVMTGSAYALSRNRCPFRKTILILIAVTLFFSAGMIPNYLMIKQLGLLDTAWAVILPGALSAWPFFVLRSVFLSFPQELEDAGRIDGINDIGIFLHLALPSSAPVVATIGFLVFISYWNLFTRPLLYLSHHVYLSLYCRGLCVILLHDPLVQKVGNPGTELAEDSLKYAGYLLMTLPPLLLSLPFHRYFSRAIVPAEVIKQ